MRIQWQQIGRKITKQNSDNLESSIQYKIDYLQVRRSTQNKTYQLWCFIFIQKTYFAILHLWNLNFDFFQFFLSKHHLCSALWIFFTILVLLPLSFIFIFAAWCISKKTLSFQHLHPINTFYWMILFSWAATPLIKPRYFHNKKCRKNWFKFIISLLIFLNHVKSLYHQVLGRVCSNPRHLMVFYFGS